MIKTHLIFVILFDCVEYFSTCIDIDRLTKKKIFDISLRKQRISETEELMTQGIKLKTGEY